MTPAPRSVGPSTSLFEALRIMDEEGVPHLPVLEQETLIGLLCDRELLAATGWLSVALEADSRPRRVEDLLQEVRRPLDPEQSLAVAAAEFLRSGSCSLPVVRGESLVGVLTEMDFLRACVVNDLCGHLREQADSPVFEHMRAPPPAIHWYSSLASAIETCRTQGVRSLPVLEAGELIAMISDRDLRLALVSGCREDTPVEGLVRGGPVAVTCDTTLSDAVKIMSELESRSLPVVEQGRCVGVISTGEILERCVDAYVRCAHASSRVPGE